MLYKHVFDKISTEFRGILHVFVNAAGFRGSATVQNIRSPVKGKGSGISPGYKEREPWLL